jgi:hypothetical protein
VSLLRKAFLILSIFFVSHVFAQGRPEDTTRAGSGGSSGTTQQGPTYDGGVLGPNGAMGGPDVTAVDRAADSRRRTAKKKKPVGTIRVDADVPKGSDQEVPENSTTTK